jgi:hypothetical protein
MRALRDEGMSLHAMRDLAEVGVKLSHVGVGNALKA